jgi:hypothetical protein
LNTKESFGVARNVLNRAGRRKPDGFKTLPMGTKALCIELLLPNVSMVIRPQVAKTKDGRQKTGLGIDIDKAGSSQAFSPPQGCIAKNLLRLFNACLPSNHRP